ncbi:MAG: hypothetical protein ACSHXY_03575 [Alphaproteobacteria bacterium]
MKTKRLIFVLSAAIIAYSLLSVFVFFLAQESSLFGCYTPIYASVCAAICAYMFAPKVLFGDRRDSEAADLAVRKVVGITPIFAGVMDGVSLGLSADGLGALGYVALIGISAIMTFCGGVLVFGLPSLLIFGLAARLIYAPPSGGKKS